jgi:hypothetical protein
LSINELLSCGNGNKFTSFTWDETIVKRLLDKCKSVNSKLTGCLNVITALATHDLYRRHDEHKLAKNIYFHLLANLRPLIGLDNTSAGYWAVVMNDIVDCESVRFEESAFWRNRFWEMVKIESDSIHERIKANELFENAKMDTLLLDMINKEERLTVFLFIVITN